MNHFQSKTHLSKNLLDRLKQDRRWFHAHAEVAYKEIETGKYICGRLKELGIPYIEGIAGTGIVATIKGQGQTEKAVGLRTDMDALPLKEQNEFGHCSLNEKAMHGCGHDGHMAIMLGVAQILSSENHFNGTVHLIFQPAEEGCFGARRMIEDGLFEKFPMQRIFALHNWPNLPENVVGCIEGPIMASAHRMEIKIKGRGGHGAMPHQATPQMSIAAHVQLAINSYLAQKKNPLKPAVVSLTQIKAGDAIAVLPDEIEMSGSFRLLDEETTILFYKEIPPLVKGIAASFGAKADVELLKLYPATVNESVSKEILQQAAKNLKIEFLDEKDGIIPAMVSEDFSFMLSQMPGCYFWLGQKNDQTTGALHQSSYDFNDNTIETGVRLFTEIVRLSLY